MGSSFRQVVQYFPELRSVVHLLGVSQFMQEHIVHQMRRQEHEVARQVDAARSGTASPSAFASGYLYFLVTEAIVLGQFAQQRRKVGLGGFLQGSDDGIPKQLLYGLLREIDIAGTEDGDALVGGADGEA